VTTERTTTANDKYAKELGFDYGNAVSNVQAEFLNGWAKAFDHNRYDKGMQLAYITHDMTPQAKAFWKDFGVFCDD